MGELASNFLLFIFEKRFSLHQIFELVKDSTEIVKIFLNHLQIFSG